MSTQPLSLGAQLAAQQKEREAAGLRKDASIEDIQNMAMVTAYFTSLKTAIVAAISKGEKLPPMAIGDGTVRGIHCPDNLFKSYSWDQRGISKSNMYYSAWKDFVDWGVSQDLKISMEYAHDGVGIKSWYNICVAPLVR